MTATAAIRVEFLVDEFNKAGTREERDELIEMIEDEANVAIVDDAVLFGGKPEAIAKRVLSLPGGYDLAA